MSAYIVNKSHIDALLRVAIEGPADHGARYPGDGLPTLRWSATDPAAEAPYGERIPTRELRTIEDAERVGAMLAAENVRSVQSRYSDDGFDTLPGPIDNGWAADALLGQYTYPIHGTGPIRIADGPRRLSTVEALKALDGYEYQSCERSDWWTSEARQYCAALRKRLIGCLAGYDEAETWSVAA